MKIKRKILSSIISLSLLVGLVTYNPKSNSYAEENNQSNILGEIKDNDFLDIKKIELDDKKQEVKSVEDVNTKSRILNLDDGTYLIDRGHGWVLGGDTSFIESGLANPGGYLRIMKGRVVGTEHFTLKGGGVEYGLPIIKRMVQSAYLHSIEDEVDMKIGFEMTAPPDKNLYVKTYATYRRFDMIEVKDKIIAAQSSTYEPTGTWAKYVTYNQGETVDQNALKERIERNVLNEPDYYGIRSSINVMGMNHFKSFDVILNYLNNTIELINRNDKKIHYGYGSQKYFSMRLLDSDNKEKASMTMSGDDYSSNPKFSKFDKLHFNIGDIIEISHEEPFLLKVKGIVSGTQITDSKVQKFRITENGLEVIPVEGKAIEDGIYNIFAKADPSYLLAAGYGGLGVSTVKDFDKNYDESKWEFKYDKNKDAYKIRNVKTNKFLTDKYYSPVKPHTLEAENELGDDSQYFRVEKSANNEISLINLKSNKAVTFKHLSMSDLEDYTMSNEQKLIIEKRN